MNTYTLRDAIGDIRYTVCYVWPGRYVAVPVMRAAAALANVARRFGRHRLARRLAWYAYDVADHTRSGREFVTLRAILPWAYPVDGDWHFQP
jgi:hypothetical protein